MSEVKSKKERRRERILTRNEKMRARFNELIKEVPRKSTEFIYEQIADEFLPISSKTVERIICGHDGF